MQQRLDFCEDLTAWHFVTKWAAVKLVKPWMSTHFSESKDPSYDSVAKWPEWPRKNGNASQAGYTHVKAAQRSTKDEVVWLRLRFCLVLCWWSTCQRLLNTVWYFETSWGCYPHREKAGVKMNEWINQMYKFLTSLRLVLQSLRHSHTFHT